MDLDDFRVYLQEAIANGDVKTMRELFRTLLRQAKNDKDWGVLAATLMSYPAAIPPDADAFFFGRCPKKFLASLLFGEEGLRLKVVRHVTVAETIGPAEVRLMCLCGIAMRVVGQKESLAGMEKIFRELCERKGGKLPRSVREIFSLSFAEATNGLGIHPLAPEPPRPTPGQPRLQLPPRSCKIMAEKLTEALR